MADDSWKNRTMIAGGVLGALLGVGAAMLYVRSEEEAMAADYAKGPQRKSIPPVALVPIAISILGVLRQIGGLAERD
jgi:ABC-type nitrate/sulfonate/bicarbonate transport system permease component